MDDVLKEDGLCELVEVNIGELGDPEPMKRCGEIGDADGGINQIDLVAGDLAGVKSETCCGNAGAENKFATREAGRQGAAL